MKKRIGFLILISLLIIFTVNGIADLISVSNFDDGSTKAEIKFFGDTIQSLKNVSLYKTSLIEAVKIKLIWRPYINLSYSGHNFSIAIKSTNAQAVTYNGTHFFVNNGKTIYAFNISGNFTDVVSIVPNNIQGMTWNGTDILIVDQGLMMRVINATGNDTGAGFDISTEVPNPEGITSNGSGIFVLQNGPGTELVFGYTSSGDYTGFNFSITAEDSEPRGIHWLDSYFYISGSTNDQIYQYKSNGDYNNVSFSVASESGFPSGLAWNGSHFFVSEGGDNLLLAYNTTISFPNITISLNNNKIYENLSNFNESYTTTINLNITAFNNEITSCSMPSNQFCIMELNFTSPKDGVFKYSELNITFKPYIINYDTEKVLETSLQDFDISIANLTNSTAIDIALFYNGTFFNPSTITKYPSYTSFNYSFYIPVITSQDHIYNFSFYFNYNHTFPERNESRTSETYNQSVYNLIIGNCSGLAIPNDAIALNISFYDLNENIVDIDYESTIFYGLTSEQLNQNFSFEDPHINNVSYCIYPNWVSIQVDQQNRWYDGTNYYDYFLNNNTFNNITQIIKLYTQNSSETTQVLFTVQDTNTDPLPNVYIHILKYDVGTGSYKTQEILKTDSQGQAIGNIILYNDYYNFLVFFRGVLVYSEQAVKLITAFRTFTIDLEGVGWIDDFEVAYGINYDLYFNNISNNFVFTWSDPTSASHFGCLKVDVNNDTGKYTLSDTCIESASGTIVYGISPYNGSTFTATGYMKFEINIVLKVIQKVFDAARKLFYREMPLFSLFISTLIMITLFCIGLPHPAIALSLMGVGMIITFILGLFTVTPIFLGGIIFLIILQIYLAGKR